MTQAPDPEPVIPFDFAGDPTLELRHVKVIYHGVSIDQARMLGNTLEAAREVYIEQFGFNMPDMFTLKVALTPDDAPTFTDRYSGLTMIFHNERAIGRPRGVIYGICHELGHVAMFRTLPDWYWISIANGEGWATYAGLSVFDEVYNTVGHTWPARSDDVPYGLASLKQQLSATQPAPDEIALAANKWARLEPVIGRKGYQRLMAAWQKADIQLCRSEHADKPLKAAIAAFPEFATPLEAWWRSPGPAFFETESCSLFTATVVDPATLSGRPLLIREDDGTAEGLKICDPDSPSRMFFSPGGGDWFLRAVSLYGQRYGPLEDMPQYFVLGLYDEKMKVVASWKQHFSCFPVDRPDWVRLEVSPTRVPETFLINLNIDNTEIDGIRIGYDTSTQGHSRVGCRNYLGTLLKEGDWMIRVELDSPPTCPRIPPRGYP